jgi:hypothetical protein
MYEPNPKFADIVDADLATQREEAHDKFQKALAAAKDKPTDRAGVETAAELAEAVDEFDAEIAGRTANVKETEAALEALSGRTFGTEESAEAEGEEAVEAAEESAEEEDDAEVEGEESAEEGAEAEVEAATKGKTTFKGAAKGSRVAQLAARTKRPAAPSAQEQAEKVAYAIVASAGNDNFNVGANLTFEQVGEAVLEKIKAYPEPSGVEGTHAEVVPFRPREDPIAKIQIPFPDELRINDSMGPEQVEEVLAYATDWNRPVGSNGEQGLVAAGWCAPSQVLYDLSADETTDGILDLPEVQVSRGGFRSTPGPQFTDFYGGGFKQTEAQAIAGTTKTHVKAVCPTFSDNRLDVVGLWITVDILTEVGYPELVRRFSQGSLVAHEHWKNADIIARIQALSTTRNATGLGKGSSVSDTLEAFSLLADQRRQSQRLAFNRPLEVVLPFWTKNVFLNDLDRRGFRTKPASDAELSAYFAARNLVVNFVYDWQVLPSASTDMTYASSFAALMYPAGTFVKGTSAVIKLGAIYDSTQLATNEYTGSFTEEGVLVAKMKLGSDYITNIPICSSGRVGAMNFTAC